MPTLEKELNHYIKNQDKLVKEHTGKYVVIKGEQILGIYETEEAALKETAKEHRLGTFIVHQIGPGEENYTVRLRSRIVI